MHVPTIAIVCNRKNIVHVSGVYSLHLRVTINRRTQYFKIPVPQKVSLAQWSGKDNAWVKNHPFAFEINNKINERRGMVNDLIKLHYNLNKSITFETISQHLNRKGDINSFYDYMKAFITSPPDKLEENTLKVYRTCLLHLQAFRKQLFFSDIDNSLILNFSRYMREDLQLVGGSCKKYMESFKRVIRQAKKEHLIDPVIMQSLFDDLNIKVGKPKRTYLEPAEIKAWRKAVFPKGKEYLERDRDLFLFQIYTGYYYKDLQIFTKDQLIEDEEFGYFIHGARDKNDNQTLIPLFKFPYAASIIRKYRSVDSVAEVFASSNFIEEPAYNRNLKDIAEYAGLSKKVSNKTGRHTNGQLWVRYGAERPIISKMMGHTKEETTKNYFSVNLPEIVEGTKRADFSKLGI